MGILGIGGIFFRAKDPEALSAWYGAHLKIGPGLGPNGQKTSNSWYWEVEAGPVVFAPFKEATDYFPADKAFMLNFRVSGIDALLEELRAAGIEVITKTDWDSPETGRFARIHDPEGNPIELWQPPD